MSREEEQALYEEHRALYDPDPDTPLPPRVQQIEEQILGAYWPLVRGALKDVDRAAFEEWKDERERLKRGEQFGDEESKVGWMGELRAEAHRLLLKAWRSPSFDPTEKGQLGSYLWKPLRDALSSAVFEHREGADDTKALDRLSKVENRFMQEHHRLPSGSELAVRVFPKLEESEAHERLASLLALRGAQSTQDEVGPGSTGLHARAGTGDDQTLADTFSYGDLDRDGYLAGYTPPADMDEEIRRVKRGMLRDARRVLGEMLVEGNLNRGMAAALEWEYDLLPDGVDRRDYEELADYYAARTGSKRLQDRTEKGKKSARNAARKSLERAEERLRLWAEGEPKRAVRRDRAGQGPNLDAVLGEYAEEEEQRADAFTEAAARSLRGEDQLLDRIDRERLNRIGMEPPASRNGAKPVQRAHNRTCEDCGLSAPAPLTRFVRDPSAAYGRANLCGQCAVTRAVERAERTKATT